MQKQNQEELYKYKRRLAVQIMDYVRDQLIVALPFFHRAILKMPVEFYEIRDDGAGNQLPAGMGTDGVSAFVHQDRALELFRQEKERLPRIYLHMLLHCIYSHPFSYEQMRKEYWDFAADAAVEHTILEMRRQEFALQEDELRRRKIEALKQRAGSMTAESVYHYLYTHPEEAEELLRDSSLFCQDIHQFWIPDSTAVHRRKYEKNPHPGINKISQDWKKLGQSVKLDIQVFEKNQGLAPGSLSENLQEVVRDRYNYEEFLRKFAVTNEEIHINHEEFDYIYYTYGMERYGNMPLIEPLEYRETKKVHDFVIAIDTSGSCQGSTVRNFLSRTYSILKSTRSFFHEVNIHVIQCDAKVQSDVKLTSDEEFEAYMKEIRISGFGGTDFRPVFQHVDQMIREGEFTDLRGLIYFTDGMGTFPERMPSYQTAFVFVSDWNKIPKIPAWAIKLVLRDEDFQEDDWKKGVLQE